MPDNTLTFGWPDKGEPCCGDKSPGHPVLICERPVAHEGVHAALIRGDGNTIAWPGVDGGTYAVTVSDQRPHCGTVRDGVRCTGPADHEAPTSWQEDVRREKATGAIVADEQRLETIRRLAAQMEMPPQVLTYDEVEEAKRLADSNRYTLTLPTIYGYPETEKVVAEEPEPFARAVFTLTTQHGEIVRLAFETRPQEGDQDEWEHVASPVLSTLAALRGLGYRQP